VVASPFPAFREGRGGTTVFHRFARILRPIDDVTPAAAGANREEFRFGFVTFRKGFREMPPEMRIQNPKERR